MKFICLNLWLGGILFDDISGFLEKEQPDILVVQEAYQNLDTSLERRFRSVEVLKEKLEYPYVFFAPACTAVLDETLRVEAGNAIFSRFPIIESHTTFFDVPYGEVLNYETPGGDYSQTPRNLQHAKITVGTTTLNVFNTQGVWGRDLGDTDRRLAMGAVIAREVEYKPHVLLAGDFNVAPDTQTIAMIEHRLKNIFRGRLDGTFNPKQQKKKFTTNVTVDMVFASEAIKVIDSYCPNVDVSDHFPLVCVCEV